ncbi:uncharacterized protein DFL_006303 [Arthrobotrys flagrans]|uniref:DUF6594 domain-containing protein n=1 Tax=Arthrobotrys flagrans TaxID=97331 RepID=A0A436ZZZ1_ARTFL|nr:hypothetical protein DFL_006303 [Arthrobotrys flagrans]
MGPTLNVQRPPYPTAETVIDSEDELDNLDERITVGNHKPNKGGIDTWVNKPAHKRNKSDEKNNGNGRTGKDRNKRWSLGVPPLTVNTSEKRQQPQGRIRTMSMSEATRQGFASEKPTHILTSLPPSSSSKDSSKNSNNHSLPTPAASPSSTTPPIDTKIGSISSSISTSASASSHNGNVANLAAKFSAAKFSAAAAQQSKNISSSSTAVASGTSTTGSPNLNRTRPRSYSAYPSSASHPSESFISGLHKPPTPVSISEDDEGESESESKNKSPHHLAMPALKKPQKAGQQVPLAPSSVVSASSGSSSPSVSSGSSGSSLEQDSSRLASFRKLSGLQTQNNGYFASVSDEVQSPMPEAPAPPSRGSAATSEASSSEDMKSGEQKQGFAPPNTVPTPKSAVPPTKNNVNARPPAHSRTYSNATVTGPEYDQDAYGQDAYGAYPYPPLNRKKNSFSSSGSRQTAIAGVAQGAPAGLGLDASVFEFLDEGEEDEAAHEEEHQAASDVSAPIPEPSPVPPRQAPAPPRQTPAPEPRPKTPVKPPSPKKATPTSAPPPRATPAHPQDPYFSSPQAYGAYGGYPMHYDPYMSTEAAPVDPTLQPAPPIPPMADPYKNLPNEAPDNAMVHTPQKSNFKESVHARRAAAAAAEAQATVEATEIEEYHEDDYPAYSSYVSPRAPPSYRGRPRMPPNQRAPPPPPPQAAHDMYAGYPPHPPPPQPQRAFQEAYPPHPHPHPHQPYRQQQAPPPPPPPSQQQHQQHQQQQQRNPMYGPGPQYTMRGQRPPPTSSLNGGYGRGFSGSQVSSYSPNFGSMLNSNVSEMATTVLGGRWNHMNARQYAPSNLSMAYNQPGYDDYYGGYEGYYDQGQYHQEEPEYEEPHSIPSASPQYSKRRPNSGEFGTPNKRNSIHSQWTAEWADTDSVKGGSRPPIDRIPEGPPREEFELGKDGNDDQSWAKPAKTRRRNTITPNKQTMFSSNFSDTSSAKLTSAASSRMQPLSEADIKSEASVEQNHPRQPPSINTSLPNKQKHGLPTPEDSPPAIKPCRAQSRPPTQHSSVAGSFLSKNAALTTIPVALGYPHLSNHLATTPNSAMYRRFDNLNHRILLHLQDEICELESILESLDNAEQSSGGGAGLRTRRGLSQTGHRAPGPLDERSARRLELMGAIFVKLQQYNNALAGYSKILNELPGATNESVREYREWMTLHQPVVPEEMDFIFKANDFSNLINDEPTSTPMRVHIPSARSSRSPSFASAQKPNLPVEGVLSVLDTLITWIMKQETPVQLGILAGIFFLMPLLLFLCVSTWFGMFMVMTACTAGFAYCAKDLLGDALKGKASKPVDGKSDATTTNNTPVGMKA